MKEKHTRIGNMAITAAILAATSGLSYLLHRVSNSDFHVPMLFVLAVLFISLVTDSYVYGIIASMAAVIGVNYIFTYPYFALNFTITGYPMTFLTMLAVSICVSALTTRIKKQEQIRLEVEKEKTRANLLRAISHDIRTPLTSIVGSASGILENQKVLTQEREMELVQDIKDEAVNDLNLRIAKILKKTPMEEDDRQNLVHAVDTAAGKVVNKLIFGLRDSLNQEIFLECVAGLEKIYEE
mgnify:CR=1 FL=1